MISRQFRKIIGLKKKDKDSKVSSKIDSSLNFIKNKIKEAIEESQIIMKKLNDLHKTNYELGLNHLDNGNIKEAIFRFKIVRKFWPENYNSHLKLIYCYLAQGEEELAQKAEEKLLLLRDDLKAEVEKTKIDASFYASNPINKSLESSQ